jgi:hypothetical protein
MQAAEPGWPALPYGEWRDSKDTLHLYLQIVGKLRLALAPPVNHWWHVTLYVNARGLTTGAIPHGAGACEIAFDFIDHALRIDLSSGRRASFPLRDGLAVSDFYEALRERLAALGVRADIHPHPYDCMSAIPFGDDRVHARYDAAAVQRFWRALVAIAGVFEAFRGRFAGKSSPVHLFWHTFDLAVTRFSGRAAPPLPGAGRVMREAYSHEVVSFGFWAGDESVPYPAFYSYTFPEPDGLRAAPLQPGTAAWTARPNGSSLAIYPYEDARTAGDPAAELLRFLESAYRAGAAAAGWDVEALAHRPR